MISAVHSTDVQSAFQGWLLASVSCGASGGSRASLQEVKCAIRLSSLFLFSLCQVALRRHFRAAGFPAALPGGGGGGFTGLTALVSAVEVKTVDKYQGRDKPCLLVSTVHSNAQGEVRMILRSPVAESANHRAVQVPIKTPPTPPRISCFARGLALAPQVGTLLYDRRRVNVLLSRARHKLLLVGSASTLAAGKGSSAAGHTLPLQQPLQQRHRGAGGGGSSGGGGGAASSSSSSSYGAGAAGVPPTPPAPAPISAELLKLLRAKRWVHELPPLAHLALFEF